MFILASKSPRRKELLSGIVKDFVILPSNVDEFLYSLDELSLVKAKAIAKDHPEDIILSADTIVLLGDEVLGKPQSREDAFRMLSELSGKKHTVKTIYTVLCEKTGICLTRSVYSDVYFNSLSEEEINAYIASGSPMDKAGAYGIQDNATYHLISRIEGSYSNIVGLPVEEVEKDLRDLHLIK